MAHLYLSEFALLREIVLLHHRTFVRYSMPSGKTKRSIQNPAFADLLGPQSGSTALTVLAIALLEHTRKHTSTHYSAITDTVIIDDEILEAATKDGSLEK